MPDAFSRNLKYIEQAGFDASTTLLTTITAGGSAAEGSWTQLIASTAADSDFIYVYLTLGGSTVEEVLIDFSVGASSSETVFIENIPLSTRSALSGKNESLWFPIRIPAGSRIAVRAQSDTAVAVGVAISLFKGDEKSSSYTAARGYGIVSANSSGTAVDAGATANTKGSWTELVASTGEQINGFWLHVGNNDNLTINVQTMVFVDIAIGASSSETIIVQNHPVISDTNETAMQSLFYDIRIPAGTRISARIQCSDTDATDRIKTVALIGLN